GGIVGSRDLITWKLLSKIRRIGRLDWAIGKVGCIDKSRSRRTEIAEVASALGHRRYQLIKILARHDSLAPFLGPEVEGRTLIFVVNARDKYGTADRISVVVLLI